MKKILKALHRKYGKEFEVKRFGGGWGTMNNNTWKAVVKPKDDPTIHVAVEITKDKKNVYDNYLSEAVAKVSETAIEMMVKSIWGESRVHVAYDTGMIYPEHSDTDMTYEQFNEYYPMNIQMVDVYLNSEDYLNNKGEFDQESEIEKYITLAKLLFENKYRRSSVNINYIAPDAYSRFDDAKYSDKDIVDYFQNDENETGKLNILTISGFVLDREGRLITTNEEIYHNFDVWRAERLKYLEEGMG